MFSALGKKGIETMKKQEAIGYLKGIDTERRMGILDYRFFASLRIVRDIIEDAEPHTLTDLTSEIESRVLGEVERKFGQKETQNIYFYFNFLDSLFDGNSNSKALHYADKLFFRKLIR